MQSRLRLLKHFGPGLVLQILTRPVLRVPIAETYYRVPNDKSQVYHLLESTAKIERIVEAIPADAVSIVDLGGNVGLFSLLAARARPNAKIRCYEADPVLAALARENTSNCPNVEIVAAAVARESGRRSFYRATESNQAGSMHRDAVEMFSPAEEIEVPAVGLSEIIDGPVDFLKVDIQGSEWTVFEGFDFSPVRAAVFEVTFLDRGAIELAAMLHRAFGKYTPLNPVHSGADILFERQA